MKLQDYIVPIILSSSIIFGMQYFFGGFAKKVDDQASFSAPQSMEQVMPLKGTVLYERQNSKVEPLFSTVHTHWGEIEFSTKGGAIVSIEHGLISDRKIKQSIQTISAKDDLMSRSPTFLLAFEEMTPVNYHLDAETILIDKAVIQYSTENDFAKIVKKFTVPYDSYRIDLEITITPKKLEKSLDFVRILFQAPYVADTDGITPTGSVIVDKKGQVQRTTYPAMTKSKELQPKDVVVFNQGWITPELFGSENKYFAHILFADRNHDIARTYYTENDGRVNAVLEFQPIDSERVIDLSFYMGPKEQDAMAQVDQKMASVFEYHGLLAPIYKFLFMLLKLLYKYIGNFGIAIIVLTLLIKLLLLPLTIRTEAAQKQQKEFEKKMNYINQKYKHDDERLQLERAELVKSQGFSLMGTLLSAFVIQIPLFMCLNYMMGNTVELYNAPFLWIPDLSGRDPFYILPLFVAGTMMAQSPVNIDAKKRLNAILMALVVGAVATRFSAGLGLFFIANTALAILQSFLIKKFSSRAR